MKDAERNGNCSGQAWLIKAAFVCFILAALSLLPVFVYGETLPNPEVTREIVPSEDYFRGAVIWPHEEPGRSVARVLETHSMEPFIMGGDLVLLEPYKGQPLHKGMVIEVDERRMSNMGTDEGWHHVLHMVADVSKDGKSVYMWGAHNLWPDGWFSVKHINSVAVRVITMKGRPHT